MSFWAHTPGKRGISTDRAKNAMGIVQRRFELMIWKQRQPGEEEGVKLMLEYPQLDKGDLRRG